MKVLIIGNGGREHALAWKCAQSADVDEVLVAPGNAGTAREDKVRNVAVSSDDIESLANLAQDEGIGLLIHAREFGVGYISGERDPVFQTEPISQLLQLRPVVSVSHDAQVERLSRLHQAVQRHQQVMNAFAFYQARDG